MDTFALVDDQQVICAVWLEHTIFVRAPAAACSQNLLVVHLLCLAGAWRKVRLCPSCAPCPIPWVTSAWECCGHTKGHPRGGCIAEGKEQVQIWDYFVFGFPPSPPSFDFYFHLWVPLGIQQKWKAISRIPRWSIRQTSRSFVVWQQNLLNFSATNYFLIFQWHSSFLFNFLPSHITSGGFLGEGKFNIIITFQLLESTLVCVVYIPCNCMYT